MKALLDMHTFLWWNTDAPQLSSYAHEIIADPENTIYLSAASAWEIAIKSQIGKLPLPEPPKDYVLKRIEQNNFQMLPITLYHALHTGTLPLHHRDPFDRILIAQSVLDDLPILTADSLIAQYDVRILW